VLTIKTNTSFEFSEVARALTKIPCIYEIAEKQISKTTMNRRFKHGNVSSALITDVGWLS
jgi:hypothetical protein